MPNDVEALFRKINQSGLPYHVFETPEPVPQPAPRPKPQLVEAAPRQEQPEPATAVQDAPPAPRRRLLSNYAAPATVPPTPDAATAAGTLLSDIFARMKR